VRRAAFTLALFVAACSSARIPENDATAAPPGVRIPITIDTDKGPLIIQAEIADTNPARMKGLMFRKSMGEKEGMIFLFPAEQPLSFWMHNTLIPLDMIFIRADRTILGVVENAPPQTDAPRSVPGKSQFVLEVNGGLSALQGIKAGQAVHFYAPIPSS
jgi:uncharacterized membrane protein (UPF0127 family)